MFDSTLCQTRPTLPRYAPHHVAPAALRTLTDSDDAAPAVLEAPRFNRHTFWCEQSGSGKTYALGVVLEQLLLGTQLPILIIDPNGDFTRLADVREESTPMRDELANLFGYAPPDMLAASPRFPQGQALFAGGFVQQPSFVQIGGRLTHEGGSDVHVPL